MCLRLFQQLWQRRQCYTFLCDVDIFGTASVMFTLNLSFYTTLMKAFLGQIVTDFRSAVVNELQPVVAKGLRDNSIGF